MGVPPPVRLCQPWRQGWPQAAHCSHTQLVHSPVHVSSLCREGSLSCNPKEIQTHTCEIRRNHWLPQKSIKLYFSLSRVCKRHLFPLALSMGDTWKHVSFHTLTVLMSISLPSSSSFSSSSSSPSQQHLCRCGPALPVTDGYRTRPSVLRCAQLLRSSGLQFRAPLCFPIVFLFSVPHSWHPCLGRASHSAGLASLRIAESLGPDTRGFCHPFASPAYLLTASLCLF